MKYAVNLFPPRRANVAERVGYFVAHYVRYAIVLTLGVVIVVFFLRVRVDQQLTEERERLVMRRSIIEATRPMRAGLEQIQSKIAHIRTVFTKQDSLTAELEYITSIIPRTLNVQGITIQETNTTIQAVASDYRIIPTFVSKLSKDARYQGVKITKVEKNSPNSYTFTIVLEGYGKS